MFGSTPRRLMQSDECSGSSGNVLVPRGRRGLWRPGARVFDLGSEEEDEDVQFDTSDMDSTDGELMAAGKHYPSIQEFASAIPNHLLLGSLLEHLCFVYESNPARSRMLFKVIGQRLASMNLLSPLAISDEFSTVRLQHNRAFTELLHAATSSLNPQGQQLVSANVRGPAIRTKEGLFQAQTSRYLSEFEEICRVGRGSYGKVFKVINKLDGQYYAVKKILIKNVSKDDCMKVLREAKVLSSLQHVNVVGYHTAWMEHVQPSPCPLSVLPALESPAQQDGTSESSDASSTSSSIIFQSDTSPKAAAAAAVAAAAPQAPQPIRALAPTQRRIPKNYVPCVFLGQPAPAQNAKCPAMDVSSSAVVVEEDSSRSNAELNNNHTDKECQQWPEKPIGKEVQFHLMLYIQMQLCERSLKDWISERNSQPKEGLSSADPYGCVDTEHSLSLLRKILEGVEYIHSRGIMHRDLKPGNIFLHSNDCHVRIGDFGLACRHIIADKQKASNSSSCACTHTTDVGTLGYAAPEKLKGSHYDSQSDMYSVGVLALELFQPFGTEMERVRTLEDLGHGNVPESFRQRWPLLAESIAKLTSLEPSARPTASQLLQSQLFSSKDMVIHGLQRRVEEQEEEIMQLRRQISQLQSSQISVRYSAAGQT